MKVVLLTREYPPDVYGGAGVHVEFLAKELSKLSDVEVEVRRFASASEPSEPAGQALGPVVREFEPWADLAERAGRGSALSVISIDLAMAEGMQGASIVHSHTWYTNLAGHLAKLLYGIPHVVTSHSLEPLRPWKAEQLGRGGYALSTFCERTALESADAVVAVSEAMRSDIRRTYPQVDPARIEVIRNGIEPAEFEPDGRTEALEQLGIDPERPVVLFVGRVTRQKGIVHLLDAAPDIDPRAQIVLAAAAPDTPEFATEVRAKVDHVRAERGAVIWIQRMLPREDLIQLMSHATVFVCPSTYEPLGIVNLEAMACGTAVVATATGGIPEVVDDGSTGLLVPFQATDDAGTPLDPARFAKDIADRINQLIGDPALARRFGEAGRRRAVEEFSWQAVAERTYRLYESLLSPVSPS
jgi:starch synthase